MIFVDTNVLVYATALGAPFHAQARLCLTQSEAGSSLCVSRQVLREYIAVVTRPQIWAKALPMTNAVADARQFAERFAVLEDGRAVWDQLLAISRAVRFGGRQVHDANLVATMLEHGVRRLLTFNVADFSRFSGMIELEPLPTP